MSHGTICLIIAGSLALGGCSSLRPLSPATRVGQRPAAQLELVLGEPCLTLPGGTPMGRPNGTRGGHRLPAARYRPAFEDDRGVYFASPSGVEVIEPAMRGTRNLPGGIQVLHDAGVAWEYLGDPDGVSARQRLPSHCHVRLEPRPEP